MPSVSEVCERLSAAENTSASGRESVLSDMSQSSVVVVDQVATSSKSFFSVTCPI
jgi:hypothetical protein